MTGRKTRVECETPRDFRDMRPTAQDSPRVAGCSVFTTATVDDSAVVKALMSSPWETMMREQVAA